MAVLPLALLTQLQQVKGFDEQQFIAAHAEASVTSIRLHPVKGNRDDADNRPVVPWCAEGRYLNARPVFTLDPAYHAGAYYVQEASSMFLDYVVRSIYPERNDLRVLDLCGAPGGKSTLLASLLPSSSLLISNEVIRSRATILAENAIRWGYANHWVTSNDPRDFGRIPGYFDLMVVDAPCSGSGLFRKDERALRDWTEANVLLCSQRQQRIITDAWPALKEGGWLVYATCSYSAQEDEEILDWLSAAYDAQSVRLDIPAGWGIVETVSPISSFYGYRFFPGKVQGEGFFIAAVQKLSPERSNQSGRFRTEHSAAAFSQALYLLSAGNYTCFKKDDSFHAIHPQHEQDYQHLRSGLYFRKLGVQLGSPAAKEWLPAHDVALSIDRSKELPEIELSTEQALKFLKKEDFGFSDGSRGWKLVTHHGLGLGWVKALGNRVNNYLPKHWRILMDLPDEDWV